MQRIGILDELEHIVKEKRKTNPFLKVPSDLIPRKLLFTLGIVAKMKAKRV
ncbi:MAG: hypothetical protein Ta2B_10110 [Termitinemataceae bacterium]|nr:MAG: hypothetical protein Ta2B_10110 [Termitinemataceae bacterium]